MADVKLRVRLRLSFAEVVLENRGKALLGRFWGALARKQNPPSRKDLVGSKTLPPPNKTYARVRTAKRTLSSRWISTEIVLPTEPRKTPVLSCCPDRAKE